MEGFEEIQEEATKISKAELEEKLTDQKKRFCEFLVFNRKGPKEALRAAGSKATEKNLSKMAWEIQQDPNVQAYIAELEKLFAIKASVPLEEVLANARRAIEMALRAGKPRDAEPHNRLLAELGGHIKNHQPTAKTPEGPVNKGTIINVRGNSGELAQEIERLRRITSPNSSIPDIEGD